MHLQLLSARGNATIIPSQGYLGLTPVTVTGVVRTRLDDGKTIMGKRLSVTIRCYEQRIGRVGSILASSVLFESQQILWSSPDYSEIGEMDFPFRIVLPPDNLGCSTVNYPDYRCFWRVEAALSHAPIFSVGSRLYKHIELPLIRYDLPKTVRAKPMSCAPDEIVTSKSRARLRYRVGCPPAAIGPADVVEVGLSIMSLDPELRVRSASLIVERRLQLKDGVSAGRHHAASESSSTSQSHVYHAQPLSCALPAVHSASSYSSPLSKSYQDSSPRLTTYGIAHYSRSNPPSPTLDPTVASSTSGSTVTDSDTRQLIHPTPPASMDAPTKTVNSTVAFAESNGRFVQDEAGIWNQCLKLQWPIPKSSGRWAVGETMNTDLVSVRFFVKVKIIISSSSGTESVELAEEQLIVVPTNDFERQVAIDKYNEQIYSSTSSDSRAKSKSPRRSRRETAPEGHSIPSVPTRPSTATMHPPSSSREARPSSSRNGAPRRPHTSAGPRDRPSEFSTQIERRERSRPETANHANVVGSRSTTSKGILGLISPRMGGNSSSSSNTSSSTDQDDEVDLVEVEAWEQELARIERASRLASRRSSTDMLGYAYPNKGLDTTGQRPGIRIHE